MFVTLSFGRLEPSLALGLAALHEWLDSWSGIGVIERGMARQGYDLQLTRYANEGWRATFYVAGREHSVTQATGTAREPTPWRAVQIAALEALGEGKPGDLTCRATPSAGFVMNPPATRMSRVRQRQHLRCFPKKASKARMTLVDALSWRAGMAGIVRREAWRRLEGRRAGLAFLR
jgi:hypothetical protein